MTLNLSDINQNIRFGQKEYLLNHDLRDSFSRMSQARSTRELRSLKTYQDIKPKIDALMQGVEYGLYAPLESLEHKSFYRAVAWNIERGIHTDAVIETLKTHQKLKQADFYLFTETDVGMARTQNRNVARDIAKALKMNYVFAPAYLNLCKGNSIEGHYEGDNELGLHGNALLSRYPIENIRVVHLENCKDKMKGSEKRIGNQSAIVCDVLLPFERMSVVVAHLDAHSSHKQRSLQMDAILRELDCVKNPVLVGGDLNTSTFDSSTAFRAFCGFWNKVLRGVDGAIDDHLPYPDRFYDKLIFDIFEKYGFQYKSLNEEGVGTLHYTVDDIRGNSLVKEVVPMWCQRVMEETIRRHGGAVSLRLDWFAGRGIEPAKSAHGALPLASISGLKTQGKDISDHDPILLDFILS